MLRASNAGVEGYAPRRRGDHLVHSYSPLTAVLPEMASDGTIAPDYENWAEINHQVDVSGQNAPSTFGVNWTAYLLQLQKRIANSLPGGETTITPSGTYPGSGAFKGAVLMRDGRIFFVPTNSTTARIYDPETDTLIVPNGTYAHGSVGGVLLFDGRVLVAGTNGRPHIYDPDSDSLFVSSVATSSGYENAVLLPDGRVLLVPLTATSARIYDPIADTVIVPTGNYGGSFAHETAVLLPDGRVFFVPLNTTSAAIYDPVTDTRITVGGFPGNFAYSCGCLMANGHVFMAPGGNAQDARIYDPETNSVRTPNPPSGNWRRFGDVYSQTLLPDGRLFLAPRNLSTARIWDPETETLSTPAGSYTGGSDFYLGSLLMKDGRVILVPFNSTTNRIAGTPFAEVPLSNSRVFSPYYNKL